MGQAEEERKVKAREYLLSEIDDKELIICQTAYDAVQNILATVAGPQEKQRAEELFQRVRIVPNDVSERAEDMFPTERISDRCKVDLSTLFCIKTFPSLDNFRDRGCPSSHNGHGQQASGQFSPLSGCLLRRDHSSIPSAEREEGARLCWSSLTENLNYYASFEA